MLTHGFRHIIFTFEDQNGENQVAGVLSMRDLFKRLILGNSNKIIPYADITENVVLLSQSDDSKRIFRSIFLKISLKRN